MVILAGDVWAEPETASPWASALHRAQRAHWHFTPHAVRDAVTGGEQYALRAADRIDLDRAIAASFRAIYARKVERGSEGGAPAAVLDALRTEGERVTRAVRGFRPRMGEFPLIIEDTTPCGSVLGSEYRRLREAAERPAVVGAGFERRGRHRTHRTPGDFEPLLGERFDGLTVPRPGIESRNATAVAVLRASLHTDRSPSSAEYLERIGYVFLHEVLGHCLARLRGRREEHAGVTAAPGTADRVAWSLADALRQPRGAGIRAAAVPWDWDPDGAGHLERTGTVRP